MPYNTNDKIVLGKASITKIPQNSPISLRLHHVPHVEAYFGHLSRDVTVSEFSNLSSPTQTSCDIDNDTAVKNLQNAHPLLKNPQTRTSIMHSDSVCRIPYIRMLKFQGCRIANNSFSAVTYPPAMAVSESIASVRSIRVLESWTQRANDQVQTQEVVVWLVASITTEPTSTNITPGNYQIPATSSMQD